MEAQIWTLIGLLAATVMGAFIHLGNRIDALGTDLRTRIDSQGADLAGRFDTMNTRIDGLEMRIDGTNTRIDGLEMRIDGTNTRIDGLSERIEELGQQLSSAIYDLGAKLDDHLRRHAS